MKIGGQAVVEGIVMRNEKKVAAAVRLPNGEINVRSQTVRKVPWLFRLVFFRGIYSIVVMLIDGVTFLLWSANQQLGKDEQIQTGEVMGTVALSFIFAMLLFIALPFLFAHVTPFTGVAFTLVEGIVRMGLFVGYLAVVSRLPDVKRMFQYHGAEHKTIHCYESGTPLTIHQVQRFTTLHPRCGTSFLVVVLIISVILFSFIQGDWVTKIIGRLLLVPLIGGISYELLKCADRFRNNIIMALLTAPGLWLQKITTQEPDDQQVEVGIAAMKEIVES
jgi:uncharacterized protein YqhQ